MFPLEILTPEKTFFAEEIESLTLETPAGQLGVLAGHAPLAIGLNPGVITINTGEKRLTAVNGEGFATVRPDKTVILCQTVEWPEELEENRIRRAIEENERNLKSAKSQTEYKLSKANLARAFNRLRMLNRR